MRKQLPLFPLNTVLFPHVRMPLHIFEARYRDMLRDCLSADRRFGIVLIKSGQEVGSTATPYDVGTVANIKEVGTPRRRALPIIVEGEQRFRITSIDRVRTYMMADVELLADGRDEKTSDEITIAAHDASRHYISAAMASQGLYRAKLEIPREPHRLADYMGGIATNAPERGRQRVLEAASLTDRLQAAIALLEEEVSRMAPVFMRSGPGGERSLFSTN